MPPRADLRPHKLQELYRLRIGDDIPDAKTPRDSKQHIESDGRKLSDAFGQMLEGEGVVIDANSAVGRQRYSEARWTKKNNGTRYGWRNQAPPGCSYDSTGHEARQIKLNAQES